MTPLVVARRDSSTRSGWRYDLDAGRKRYVNLCWFSAITTLMSWHMTEREAGQALYDAERVVIEAGS